MQGAEQEENQFLVQQPYNLSNNPQFIQQSMMQNDFFNPKSSNSESGSSKKHLLSQMQQFKAEIQSSLNKIDKKIDLIQERFQERFSGLQERLERMITIFESTNQRIKDYKTKTTRTKKNFPKRQIKKAVSAYNSGESALQIADRLKCNERTVTGWAQKAKKERQ